jgi:hypothetical protein
MASIFCDFSDWSNLQKPLIDGLPLLGHHLKVLLDTARMRHVYPNQLNPNIHPYNYINVIECLNQYHLVVLKGAGIHVNHSL